MEVNITPAEDVLLRKYTDSFSLTYKTRKFSSRLVDDLVFGLGSSGLSLPFSATV